MKLRFALAAILALFLLVPAAPARADVVLTPYVGSLFGGDLSGSRTAFGASAAFMGGGVFGAEFGFNYAPEFVSATVSNEDIAQMSLMGNLIVGIPVGSSDQAGHVRPYITGGAGLFRITSAGVAVLRSGQLERFRAQLRRRRDGVLQRARGHSRRHPLFPHADRWRSLTAALTSTWAI